MIYLEVSIGRLKLKGLWPGFSVQSGFAISGVGASIVGFRLGDWFFKGGLHQTDGVTARIPDLRKCGPLFRLAHTHSVCGY